MKILAELEFNENDLGPKWMNLDNLEILLYTEASTRRGLLKVISFEEEPPNKKLGMGAFQCPKCKVFQKMMPVLKCPVCNEDTHYSTGTLCPLVNTVGIFT